MSNTFFRVGRKAWQGLNPPLVTGLINDKTCLNWGVVMEFRDPFLRVSVSKATGLLNIAKKWLSKTSKFNEISLLYFRPRNNKTDRKNARNLKIFNLEVMTTFFKKFSAKFKIFEILVSKF